MIAATTFFFKAAAELSFTGDEALQMLRREHGAGPGPKILGRELVARNRADVRIHVRGFDADEVAVLADVLKEQLAG